MRRRLGPRAASPSLAPRLAPRLAPLLAPFLVACPGPPDPGRAQAREASAAADTPGDAASARPSDAPRFIHAGAGEIPTLVLAARQELAAGEELIVYVGAHWCEPCQYFHTAVDEGQLDAVFPGLRLLEFDLDEDRERLAEAGYASRMIPLFAVPGPDGRAGPRRMQGGIKGPGAVEHIRPRLSALLEQAKADRAARAN